jgi:hypothetical protein
MVHNLKLKNCLFLELQFNILRPWLTAVTETVGSETPDKGGLLGSLLPARIRSSETDAL